MARAAAAALPCTAATKPGRADNPSPPPPSPSRSHLQITGPVSSAEWRAADMPVEAYRVTAPGTLKAGAPPPGVVHAEADKVYDIRYWVRDTRRSDFVVGGTNKLHHRKYELDVTSVKLEGLPPMPPRGLGGWKATDFSLTQTNLTSGARVPYLDNPNDGYTQ